MRTEPVPHIVIEIGTNVGSDTERIYKAARPCMYYAFEPNPASSEIFRRRSISRQVHFEETAIGNIDGTMEFNQCDCVHPVNKRRFTGASSLFEPTDILLKKHPWIKMTDKIEVTVRKLDTIMEIYRVPRPVTFIWCDAQGAEGQIVQGAVETLKHTKYFYFEYFTKEMYKGCMVLDEIMELLPGWEVVEKYAGDVLVRNSALF